ncbi:MAG TPA: 3-dehydroquinate synthase [Kofleriaceae bacterium]|nr:3-dehydroquinate synthase [Kofleriaceae bacterium]
MRSVFLIGFMAAGKTTAGRLLAERMAVPFIDLDDMVADLAGLPVPEIFERRGEAEFRRLETEALERILARAPAVVATGGGTPCRDGALETMRRHGLVIALAVPLDVALARAGGASERPLLSRPADQIAALYHEREPIYRQAHAVIATDWRDPGEVADECAELISRAAVLDEGLLPESSIVALGERSYPIAVARGGLARLGSLARAALGAGCTRAALVADSGVDRLYGAAAAAAMASADFDVVRVPVPVGEPAKSITAFATLCDQLVGAGLDRGSAVVALGGGVVGDLAGFAAATLFRGVQLVQVPTTLVAMVDSAIGGKTGINLAAGKNLVGAFWQPRLVLADPDLLLTLPARERRAAFGELLKYALLDGENLYAAAEELAPALAREEWTAPPPGLGTLIRRCTAIKSWIVSRDEREQSGERALLNLGHTVGHAIEAAAGYGEVLHGEAVALGLIAACRVSAALDLAPPGLEARVTATLARGGLSTELDPWLRPDVLERVGVDKKRTGTGIRFVGLAGPGQTRSVTIELDQLKGALAAAGRP